MRFNNIRFAVIIAALAMAALSSAAAQNCNGQFGAGTFCGNSSATTGFPSPQSMTSMLDRNFGAPSAQGTVLNRGASVWSATINPVIGNPGSTTGTLGIASSSGGTATITPAAVAGSTAFQLPSISGTFPSTASSPLVLNSATGVLTCPSCVTGTGGALTINSTTVSGGTDGFVLYSSGGLLENKKLRQLLLAPVNFYFSPSGSDSNNCSMATPCQTPTGTGNYIQSNYDLNGQTVNIYAAPGNTYASMTLNGPFVGDTVTAGGGLVTLVGSQPVAITNATNASPIVVTSAAHGLSNGAVVCNMNVGGNTRANGCWTIGSVTTNTFALVNSTGSGAYTSGGTFTCTSCTVISGTAGAAVAVNGPGASLNISGFKLTSSVSFDAQAQDGGYLFFNGPIELGNSGTNTQQLWSTRFGLFTTSAPIAISGGNYQFAQVSHLGQLRWNIYPVDFVANVAYSNAVVYALQADFTETGGAGPMRTNGYTVTSALQYAIIESGSIQTDSGSPPAVGFFPGGTPGFEGYWTNTNDVGTGPLFSTYPTFAQIVGGTGGTIIKQHDASNGIARFLDSGITALGEPGALTGILEFFNTHADVGVLLIPPSADVGTISITLPSTSGTLWNCAAGGACIDSIGNFSGLGLLARTAAGTYGFRGIQGTTNNIAVSNGNGVSGNPSIAIDSAYVGQTSITTVGTLTTGAIGSGFTAIPNSALANSSVTVVGQTCTLGGASCAPAPITNTLGGTVSLAVISTFYDGPSVAYGTTGTGWASGTVTLSATAVDSVLCKLWDGTTTVSQAIQSTTTGQSSTISLSGYKASPAGNMRISCEDLTAGGNVSMVGTYSTISAHRIQ